MISIRPVNYGTIPLFAQPNVPAEVPCLDAKDWPNEIEDDVPQFHPAYGKSGLPLPPEPMRPKAKLGQIVWPCWGLSRYAVGHVLVSTAGMKSLLDTFLTFGRSVDVILRDDRQIPVGAAARAAVGGILGGIAVGPPPVLLRMFVQAYRPLNEQRSPMLVAVDVTQPQAWVLTLVDFRFFFASEVANGTGNFTSWGNVISDSSASVLHQWTTPPSPTFIDTMLSLQTPAYDPPKTDCWNSNSVNYEALPIYYDAACAAVNLRMAFKGIGEWVIQDSGTAVAAWTTWFNTWQSLSIGGALLYTYAEAPGDFVYMASNQVGSFGAVLGYGATGAGSSLRADTVGSPLAIGTGNHVKRFKDDVFRWMTINSFAGSFAGLIPLPDAAVPYSVIYIDDGVTVETRIQRGPTQYPWPLVAPKILTTQFTMAFNSTTRILSVTVGGITNTVNLT